MAPDDKKPKSDEDEGWIEVEPTPGAPASSADAAPVAAERHHPDPDEDLHVYQGKPTGTPPGRISIWTGGIGLVLLALVYLFGELRRFDTAWDDNFPTVYPLMVFPVLGVLWGVIGLLGKQFRGQRRSAAIGLLVSLAAGVVAAGIIATDPGDPPGRFDAMDERLNMTGEELADWRQEKLRQDQ